MPPEHDASERAAQRALGDYIRDPGNAPPPAGIEERRLKVYRELFFNNLESLLGGTFPVIRKTLATRWPALVRDFYREHPSQTPVFTEIPREFVRHVQARARRDHNDDPPWLPELAHYEWAELALQIRQARAPACNADIRGDALLDNAVRLSPLAWPLSYTWPVHRISPDYQPDVAPAEPTCLLLQRDTDGRIGFQQLSALTFRLLQRLQQHPGLDGRNQLQALAREAATSDDDSFIAQGLAMLEQLHATGVIVDVRSD